MPTSLPGVEGVSPGRGKLPYSLKYGGGGGYCWRSPSAFEASIPLCPRQGDECRKSLISHNRDSASRKGCDGRKPQSGARLGSSGQVDLSSMSRDGDDALLGNLYGDLVSGGDALSSKAKPRTAAVEDNAATHADANSVIPRAGDDLAFNMDDDDDEDDDDDDGNDDVAEASEDGEGGGGRGAAKSGDGGDGGQGGEGGEFSMGAQLGAQSTVGIGGPADIDVQRTEKRTWAPPGTVQLPVLRHVPQHNVAQDDIGSHSPRGIEIGAEEGLRPGDSGRPMTAAERYLAMHSGGASASARDSPAPSSPAAMHPTEDRSLGSRQERPAQLITAYDHYASPGAGLATPALPATGSQGGSQGSGLYVRGMAWWASEDALVTTLSEFGRVRSVTFQVDKVTGKSRGTAFVDFFDAGAGKLAVSALNRTPVQALSMPGQGGLVPLILEVGTDGGREVQRSGRSGGAEGKSSERSRSRGGRGSGRSSQADIESARARDQSNDKAGDKGRGGSPSRNRDGRERDRERNERDRHGSREKEGRDGRERDRRDDRGDRELDRERERNRERDRRGERDGRERDRQRDRGSGGGGRRRRR